MEACVSESVAEYFKDLDGVAPHNLYDMIMGCFERPLLAAVLEKAGGNQSKAAQWLGMNRNTLRRKITEYDL